MNTLDPIKELYNLYFEEEISPQIVEIMDNRLDLDSDFKDGPANVKTPNFYSAMLRVESEATSILS